MDTLERAIRSALEKGNAGDRTYREKVYQSAFAALERALGNPNVTAEAAAERRASLQETITRVEREHLASAAPVAGDSPRPRVEPAPPRGDNPSFLANEPDDAPFGAPSLDPEDRRDAPGASPLRGSPPRHARQEPRLASSERVEPVLDEYRIDADLDETVRGETRDFRRKRRPFAWLFLFITAVAVAAVAAWWVVGSGLLLPASVRDGSVPNPSPIREEEGFEPTGSSVSGNAGAPRLGGEVEDPNAIAIFSPGEQDDFTVPGDAVAQLRTDVPGALRIRSGRSGSAVAFNVPQEVLQQIAGRRALFVVEAQAEDGQATQISISCAFGELGDCGGRRRFDVSGERSDVIFDVDLPTVQPGSDGTIAIVSDVSNSGKAVDIFSIRVSAN